MFSETKGRTHVSLRAEPEHSHLATPGRHDTDPAIHAAPRAAVIDPYSTGAQIAGVLAERGVETVAVLANRAPASIRPAQLNPSDYVHVHTYRGDVESSARMLAALGVSRVITGWDSGIYLADRLARALGQRGNDPLTSALRCEPYAMAETLRAFGLAYPRTIAADNNRDARRAAQFIGTWPVVVKPATSIGGARMTFARSMAEVDRAAAAVLASPDVSGHVNSAVLCQQYLTGTQFVINTVSRVGLHRLAEVWRDRRTSTAGYRMIRDRMDLLAPNDPRIPGLYEYLSRCLTALGIDEGPAHSTVMLTDAGPMLIKIQARIGGGDSVALMRAATGSSHADAALQALLGELRHSPGRQRAALYPYSKPVSKLFLQAPRDAVLGPAEAIAALLEIPTVAGLVHPLRPGTAVAETVDVQSSPGTVYLIGRERKSVRAACDEVRRLEYTDLYTPVRALEPMAPAGAA